MDNSKDPSSLQTIAFFVRTYPAQTLLVVLALILAGFAETLGVTALLPLVTIVVEGESAAASNGLEVFVRDIFSHLHLDVTLETMLSLVVIVVFVKSIILFFTMRYVGVVSADMARQLRLRLLNALMNARWSYFVNLPTGKIANAMSEQANRAGQCYNMAGQALASIIQIFVYLGIALFVSWQVSVLALVMGVLLAFSVKGFISMARNAGRDMTGSMNDMLTRLNEALNGVKPLKAMAKEKLFVQKLEEDASAVLKSQKGQFVSNILLKVAYEPIVMTIMALSLYLVLTQTETPVSGVLLLAFLFYRLMGYTNLAQNYYQKMAQFESALWDMVRQSDTAGDYKEVLNGRKKPALKKKIEFKNASVSYGKKSVVFRDFTETIPANKITLLFGPSGIGKTTLMDAVMGMHPLDDGQVLMDGTPLQEINVRKWRGNTAYVPQDTFLFHDTLLQNITLGQKCSKKDIENAMKKAAALDFVQELPDGLNTIAGERGGRLSGGQRQRIALARAFVRKPELLILDEATTGLDKKSEESVLKSLKVMRKETTIIMISHDPRLKKIADHVINLSKPKRRAK